MVCSVFLPLRPLSRPLVCYCQVILVLWRCDRLTLGWPRFRCPFRLGSGIDFCNALIEADTVRGHSVDCLWKQKGRAYWIGRRTLLGSNSTILIVWYCNVKHLHMTDQQQRLHQPTGRTRCSPQIHREPMTSVASALLESIKSSC